MIGMNYSFGKMKYLSLSLLLVISYQILVKGLVHHLQIRHDDRSIFKIETFGFVAGGVMNITVTNFAVLSTLKEKEEQEREREKASITSPPTPAALEISLIPTLSPTVLAESKEDKPKEETDTGASESESDTRGSREQKKAEENQDGKVSSDIDGKKLATKEVETPTKVVEKDDSSALDDKAASSSHASKQQPGSVVSHVPKVKTDKEKKEKQSSEKNERRLNDEKGSQSSAATKVGVVPFKIGFVMRKALSESTAQQDVEKLIELGECIHEHLNKQDVLIDLSDRNDWKRISLVHAIDSSAVGMYSLLFFRCVPSGPHLVNFQLEAEFYNPGPNYLSAGDTQLPTLYLVFFWLFAIALVVWCWALMRDPATGGVVHRIHYMMLILLSLKCLTLLFESIRYHYISMFGVSELWSIVYYFFACLKGVMLFTVILLIGSGWSLMKSYLNDKEKKTILFVLMLQVLDNIAMVVIEETAPGSQGWLTWRDLLHLIDIVCCCAILMPIVWSIRHLRQAAEVDGKAHNSLMKLQLFRQFYVMVVMYIYFTRIVVYLITATIPFYLLWLGPLAEETAALMFYVITGYKFRPAVDNPYIPVRTEMLEAQEYGLEDGELGDDDGVEMYYK